MARNMHKWVFVSLLLAYLLTGCIKIKIGVDLKSDDTGTLSMMIGMSKELLAFMSVEGESPMEELKNELPDDLQEDDVEFSFWADDEYEWLEGIKQFHSLNELNQLMAETEFFESFSLTKEQTMLKEKYVLDAKFMPFEQLFESEGEMPTDFDIDPAEIFDLEFNIRLPGELTENTGNYLAEENKTEWRLEADQQEEIHAVSEVWNTRNMTILGIGSSLICVVIILYIGFVIYVLKKT